MLGALLGDSLGALYGTLADYRQAQSAVSGCLSFWQSVGLPVQFKAAAVQLQTDMDSIDAAVRLQAAALPAGLYLSAYADAADLVVRADALKSLIGAAVGQSAGPPTVPPAPGFGGAFGASLGQVVGVAAVGLFLWWWSSRHKSDSRRSSTAPAIKSNPARRLPAKSRRRSPRGARSASSRPVLLKRLPAHLRGKGG